MNQQQHQQDIISSRRRGFGGSDAKLIYKIGTRGLDALTTTDIKRIQVALGRREPDVIEATPAMQAGHDFEGFIERELRNQGFAFKREVLIEGKDAITAVTRSLPFDVFAHADFATEWCEDGAGWMRVLECKYSQDETAKVAADYMAQLQWYYWLGADEVTLCHGWGGVFPFNVEGMEYVDILRDESYLCAFDEGVLLLSAAIKEGMFSEAVTDVAVTECPELLQAQIQEVAAQTWIMKKAEEKLAEMKKNILLYMENCGILNIKGGSFSISYVQPSERKTFDTKKAQAKYADLKGDEFYKTSKVSASVRITVKEKGGSDD